jgi:hypothetical protein
MEQLRWLQGRNACGADKECLTNSYQARLQQLAQGEAASARQHAAPVQGHDSASNEPVNPQYVFPNAQSIVAWNQEIKRGQGRHFCDAGYCATEWVRQVDANETDYAYDIQNDKIGAFQSTCERFGTRRYCWATTGKGWIDNPTGAPDQWATERWFRQNFAESDLPAPVATRSFTPPPAAPVRVQRGRHSNRDAQLGAAVAGAVMGQILSHIH